MNLTGCRILSTRPSYSHDAWSLALTKAGATVLSFPLLEILPSEVAWFPFLPDLKKVSQAIFTSPNAVIYTFQQLARSHCSWPQSILTTAIGQGTARLLEKQHIRVDHQPIIADSEHLLALPSLQEVQTQIILLFKGEGGRPLIAETLKKRRAILHQVIVYQRRAPRIDQRQLKTWWQESAIDIMFFTSQEAMQNLFILADKCMHSWLRGITCWVISKRLAKEAAQLGMKDIQVLSMPAINKDYFHG